MGARGGTPGTVRGLIGSSLGMPTGRGSGGPDFSKVLPTAMADLVARGLFVADPEVDGGYRITEEGRALLRQLSSK